MPVAGIDVIGSLPPEIQVITVFLAAICTASKRHEAAKELISFLASPQADSVKLRHGMEPS
jgi:molybdate transport system substrate-binding protein